MTLRNNTDTKSPLTLKNRVFTEKAQELLGVGRTFLMEKKANGEFIVGIHWVYSSGRPKVAFYGISLQYRMARRSK